jgi:hypothetical protein
VDEINAAFQQGTPSNRLAETGLVVRLVDGIDDSDSSRPWLPCPRNYWCGRFHSQMPASIVHQRAPFTCDLATCHIRCGVVLDPALVTLHCIYPSECCPTAHTVNALSAPIVHSSHSKFSLWRGGGTREWRWGLSSHSVLY